MSQEGQENEKSLTERTKEKAARVKQHLQDNKATYLAAAGGAVVGSTVVGVFALRGRGVSMLEIQQNAKNIALIVWKSPPTNIALVRNACPDPIPVLDKVTGIPYPSITQAMKATGKTMAFISEDIHGRQEFFKRLPESVFA